MSSGIIYLLTGPGHAARLAVSLSSLRRHYDGPVTVFTTQDESHRIVAALACDGRLGIEHRRTVQFPVRRNSTFVTKVAVLRESPYSTTLFLDADTLVVGSIEPLFQAAGPGMFAATQFSKWRTDKRVIRNRISRWLQLNPGPLDANLFRERIESAMEPRPAINTGVFALAADSPLREAWLEWTRVGHRTFICDEIALQILLHHHPHAVLDCRFNCSPVHAGETADVRIWHFHGDKHLRGRAGDLWLPVLRECEAMDLGGIREWGERHDEPLREFRRRQVPSNPQVATP